MSTTTFMANRQNTVRKWYVLDAADKPLGRTAVIAAKLLRGKHKPEFTPNADCG
ncbi:MAG: uL13 family ribosomal protein, partial [Oscillospiraceae bacterium]